MSNVQAPPAQGFLIVDGRGERICGAEFFEVAMRLLRLLPSARRVKRVSDGAVCAEKQTPRPRVEDRINVWLRGAAA